MFRAVKLEVPKLATSCLLPSRLGKLAIVLGNRLTFGGLPKKRVLSHRDFGGICLLPLHLSLR